MENKRSRLDYHPRAVEIERTSVAACKKSAKPRDEKVIQTPSRRITLLFDARACDSKVSLFAGQASTMFNIQLFPQKVVNGTIAEKRNDNADQLVLWVKMTNLKFTLFQQEGRRKYKYTSVSYFLIFFRQNAHYFVQTVVSQWIIRYF